MAAAEDPKCRMKRRDSFRHRQWRARIVGALLVGLCLGSLALMQAHYGRIASLASRAAAAAAAAARTRTSPPPVGPPKIAFLFIARNRLPLDVIWDAFFKGDEDGRFSIFVHSRPGFLFNEATTRSAYFYGRQVNDSIQVDWGESSMIQAERVLLKNALRDPSNRRFVFVSDSCIPLYNFSYIYDYIMSSSNSFVDSFADTKEGRYNPKMHPVIPLHNWRKGSQWAVLIRKHAKVVVRDETVFPIFQQHCRRKSLPEFWRDRPLPADASKEHNCIPDEHYVQTLLAVQSDGVTLKFERVSKRLTFSLPGNTAPLLQEGLEEEITRRSLTHTSWDLSASKDHERRGWHPVTYKLSDATATLKKSIKQIDNIYYETEYRREWCSSKGKPSRCFLFARKFTRAAALQLLTTSALWT